MIQESMSLGRRIAPFLGSDFFRPLLRKSAPVYVDCAERLAEAVDDGGQMDFSQARQLIREVLINHPDIQLEEDEGGAFRDLNQRAAHFFNKLIEATWIEPRRVSLDEHYVLITPQLRRLLRLLREFAENRPAELKDFAATLNSICDELSRNDALDPNRLGPEPMRMKLKDLLERVERAEEQMHAVESLVLQHQSAQRTSASAQETLQRFLVDFHAGEHMVCYDALQEAGLPPKLAQARSVAGDALYDTFVKQRLAEGLQKHDNVDPSTAYAKAEAWLTRLERKLASIPNKQKIIDGRMSDFARMSEARYRYQTEMRKQSTESVEAYMGAADRQHAGQSFSDLAGEQGMALLSPQVEVFFGAESLSRPRRPRASVDLTVNKTGEKNPSSAMEEIRRRNMAVLTPQRAARFVEKRLAEKGAKLSTENIDFQVGEDLLDLLAALAFDRGNSPVSGRQIRWKVHTPRTEFGLEPWRIPVDTKAGHHFERFTLERLI